MFGFAEVLNDDVTRVTENKDNCVSIFSHVRRIFGSFSHVEHSVLVRPKSIQDNSQLLLLNYIVLPVT